MKRNQIRIPFIIDGQILILLKELDPVFLTVGSGVIWGSSSNPDRPSYTVSLYYNLYLSKTPVLLVKLMPSARADTGDWEGAMEGSCM